MKSKLMTMIVMAAATATTWACALRTYDVRSDAMNRNVPVTVLLPNGYDESPARRYPLVILLHGASDTDRHAHHPLFREAVDRHQFVLVAPRGTRSWWMDSPVDPACKYETFVVREMLPWVESQWRTIPDRMHRALTGNSMGGHGSLYLALRHKDLFGAVGNIFGGLDLWAWRDKGRWELRERLGDPNLHPEYWKDNSVVNLAKGLKDGELATFTAVGRDDIFIEPNRQFHKTLAKNGVRHLYLEKAGCHAQEFWEEMYPKMLAFLANWFKTQKLEFPDRPNSSSVSAATQSVQADPYLDLTEIAVSAYSDELLSRYLAAAERDGVQEHGFPRLAANLGVLVANGRCKEKREILKRMMDVSCRDAAKGKMPPRGGGNEFSVRELVTAFCSLEAAGSYPKDVLSRWSRDLMLLDARTSYTTGKLSVGGNRAQNWVVFACASEQARLAAGLGGDPAFVETHVADQLRWFDANGMYRDPDQPAVYDFVTRLQFAQLLHDGYDGPSRAKLEVEMDRSAEPTLRMLSAAGEMPFGGRSNQFLHNNMFYAALCEWYAARYAARSDRNLAGRFRAAAERARQGLSPYLSVRPLRHVKNFYPHEEGKGACFTKPDMGCEAYAYFEKYMVTMGSWSTLGWLYAHGAMALPQLRQQDAEPMAFATTPDFHFVFLRAGGYSAQFDYGADKHYDCDGLGRLQRSGAPAAICLSTPCALAPRYRIETTNETTLAIMPVVADGAALCPSGCGTNGASAWAEWKVGALDWRCELSDEGLEMTLDGAGAHVVSLPAFAFDGRRSTRIAADSHSLSVAYDGWLCRYVVHGGTIRDTGISVCNRNGRYRRYEAFGEARLRIGVVIEKARQQN